MSKNFALLGAAGYIAPRHFRAIKETGNNLVAIFDPNDSVGVIDQYFMNACYFKEFERFDRHIEKLRRSRDHSKIDYVSICSPNYLHDAHVRFALRVDAEAICEKPLVLNPWNIDSLVNMEKELGKKVNAILQLRLHPSIATLKSTIDQCKKENNRRYNVDLTYITTRGMWYLYSWKGDPEKSGGVIANIGIHFFDMLVWIFGKIKTSRTHLLNNTKASGVLELEKATVRWYLSIDFLDFNKVKRDKEDFSTTYRSIKVDGKEMEFSNGFTDLHTISYRDILKGNGFGLEDARLGVEASYAIRNSLISDTLDDCHPFLKNGME
ncbi:MAG: Gfo/Idh/MocA family oxidoreductase [Oligoflexia bacterium]|nr:Gfo/Idh/MocA family oxidoreductase [Oligoflexia bacterium]